MRAQPTAYLVSSQPKFVYLEVIGRVIALRLVFTVFSLGTLWLRVLQGCKQLNKTQIYNHLQASITMQTAQVEHSGQIQVNAGKNPRELYVHQNEAIKALDQKNKFPFEGLLVLPTGGGKTLTAVHWLLRNLSISARKFCGSLIGMSYLTKLLRLWSLVPTHHCWMMSKSLDIVWFPVILICEEILQRIDVMRKTKTWLE